MSKASIFNPIIVPTLYLAGNDTKPKRILVPAGALGLNPAVEVLSFEIAHSAGDESVNKIVLCLPVLLPEERDDAHGPNGPAACYHIKLDVIPPVESLVRLFDGVRVYEISQLKPAGRHKNISAMELVFEWVSDLCRGLRSVGLVWQGRK